MANFVQSLEYIPIKQKKTVTIYGGGPAPENLALDVIPDKVRLIKVTPTKVVRPGSEYDWEVEGKFPGSVKLEAKVPKKAKNRPGSIWSEPMNIIVTGLIKIIFQPNGEGTMECVGLGERFRVLGQPRRRYPKDITVDPITDPSIKSQRYLSKEYGVWMPWAIRIWGQFGIYIHQFPDNLRANGGPSSGCIHVGELNAKKVFDYVAARTRITIAYPW